MQNYNKFTLNNTRSSGGTALFINQKFPNVKVRHDLNKQSNYLESLFLEIEINDKKSICGVIYHRPGSDHNRFINDLEAIVDKVNAERKKLYILGDFNLNLFHINNNNNVQEFMNMMHSKNLYCTINKVYCTAHGAYC